jgi:hypothetical protein
MSFSLHAWKTPGVSDEDEARSLFDKYNQTEDERLFGESNDVVSFYDELMQRFPPQEADESLKPEDNPWAETPERSSRIVELHLRSGAPDQVLDEVVDLARKYGLVLYDPQGPSLHSPEQHYPEDIPGQVRQALIAGTVGAAMVYGATYIPYRLLSWPLIGIGGFLVIMTLYTLVVLWKPEWQPK